jgi:hypothetical protein
MRVEEIISEAVEKADIDWQNFAVVMAASAVERNVPKGIDGIVYLGLIGDPGNVDVNVRLRRPAQIGLDMSPRDNGYVTRGASAQFFYSDDSFGSNMNIAGANGLKVGKDFDILINWQGNTLSEWATARSGWNHTIAHELMHRGFAIIESIPAIVSQIPEPSKTYFSKRYAANISGLINSDSPGAFRPLWRPNSKYNTTLEHLMIYAILESAPKVDSSNPSQRVAELQNFRKIYLDIEAAARKYILSYPIPKGSLASLRDELDGKTPSNVDVQVAVGPNNIPTVTLSVVDKIKNLMKPAATPPSTPVDPVKKIQGLMKP